MNSPRDAVIKKINDLQLGLDLSSTSLFRSSWHYRCIDERDVELLSNALFGEIKSPVFVFNYIRYRIHFPTMPNSEVLRMIKEEIELLPRITRPEIAADPTAVAVAAAKARAPQKAGKPPARKTKKLKEIADQVYAWVDAGSSKSELVKILVDQHDLTEGSARVYINRFLKERSDANATT